MPTITGILIDKKEIKGRCRIKVNNGFSNWFLEVRKKTIIFKTFEIPKGSNVQVTFENDFRETEKGTYNNLYATELKQL